MNDQKAIELINRSLSEPLSDQESAELERHLAGSPQSLEYFELSQQIQQALVEQADEIESGPGLSQVARSRIAKRLATEIATGQLGPGGEARRVAEDNTDYQTRTDNPDSQDNRST